MMDFSEKYVKMCKKAEEIQQLAHPKYSFLSRGPLNEIVMVHWDGHRNEQYFWLPTQGQLQNIMDYSPLMTYIHDLETFCYHELYRKPQNYQNWSWERLWLAFVMKEKFNKTWNDEKKEWIEEK